MFKLKRKESDTYHSPYQTITKPTCEFTSMSFLEVCFVSQKTSTNYKKHCQAGAEEHILQQNKQ